jgi:predicted dehydrogenase
LWLAGRQPRSYSGFSRTANVERQDDRGSFRSDVADGMFAVLDFGDGLAGRLALDATNVVNSSTLAVYSENRTAAASGEGTAWAQLYTVDENESSELQLAAQRYDHMKSVQPNIPLFMLLLDQFAAKIQGQATTLPTLEDGLNVQRVMKAVGYEDA